jgi:hypothetical protein
VVDKGDSLDVDDLPLLARRWHKVTDAVAVVVDLKNSTKAWHGEMGCLDGQHLQSDQGRHREGA